MADASKKQLILLAINFNIAHALHNIKYANLSLTELAKQIILGNVPNDHDNTKLSADLKNIPYQQPWYLPYFSQDDIARIIENRNKYIRQIFNEVNDLLTKFRDTDQKFLKDIEEAKNTIDFTTEDIKKIADSAQNAEFIKQLRTVINAQNGNSNITPHNNIHPKSKSTRLLAAQERLIEHRINFERKLVSITGQYHRQSCLRHCAYVARLLLYVLIAASSLLAYSAILSIIGECFMSIMLAEGLLPLWTPLLIEFIVAKALTLVICFLWESQPISTILWNQLTHLMIKSYYSIVEQPTNKAAERDFIAKEQASVNKLIQTMDLQCKKNDLKYYRGTSILHSVPILKTIRKQMWQDNELFLASIEDGEERFINGKFNASIDYKNISSAKKSYKMPLQKNNNALKAKAQLAFKLILMIPMPISAQNIISLGRKMF